MSAPESRGASPAAAPADDYDAGGYRLDVRVENVQDRPQMIEYMQGMHVDRRILRTIEDERRAARTAQTAAAYAAIPAKQRRSAETGFRQMGRSAEKSLADEAKAVLQEAKRAVAEAKKEAAAAKREAAAARKAANEAYRADAPERAAMKSSSAMFARSEKSAIAEAARDAVELQKAMAGGRKAPAEGGGGGGGAGRRRGAVNVTAGAGRQGPTLPLPGGVGAGGKQRAAIGAKDPPTLEQRIDMAIHKWIQRGESEKFIDKVAGGINWTEG